MVLFSQCKNQLDEDQLLHNLLEKDKCNNLIQKHNPKNNNYDKRSKQTIISDKRKR